MAILPFLSKLKEETSTSLECISWTIPADPGMAALGRASTAAHPQLAWMFCAAAVGPRHMVVVKPPQQNTEGWISQTRVFINSVFIVFSRRSM